MNVGFVGLGAMGAAMAMRMVGAGYNVTVYNRSIEKTEPLRAKGALLAKTPAAAAQDADVVFSMLFDDAAVESATFGEAGIASTLKEGAIHVCSSTLSLGQATRLKQQHEKRGQHYLSVPVLGRPPAAEAGELFVIAAGPKAQKAKLQPLFDVIGQRTFNVGEDPVQANIVKVGLNFMIFSTIEQMAEVFTLCEKGGVDPKAMFEIMTKSFYTAPVHKNYGSIMVEKAYSPAGAPMGIGVKDNDLFLDAGKNLEVPLPYASVLHDRFLSSFAAGDGDLDFTAIFEQVRRNAGLQD